MEITHNNTYHLELVMFTLNRLQLAALSFIMPKANDPIITRESALGTRSNRSVLTTDSSTSRTRTRQAATAPSVTPMNRWRRGRSTGSPQSAEVDSQGQALPPLGSDARPCGLYPRHDSAASAPAYDARDARSSSAAAPLNIGCVLSRFDYFQDQ